MKAFPRSNKYTLCLLGLVLAIELGWCLSPGNPRGAPQSNASSRAALATLSDRLRHRAVPGSLCAPSCRCEPRGTHVRSILQKSPQKEQEPCRCSEPGSLLPVMSMCMCCTWAASSIYLHRMSVCAWMCVYAVPAC